MTVVLCTACGTSYAGPQTACAICQDERQYVPPSGQTWTTRDDLARRCRNTWRQLEPGLLALHTEPKFAIGQRALILRTPAGNILWDCIANLDPATETLVKALGGLHTIAISHPHYYTTMQDWSDAFAAPIHLHAADREWVMRSHASINFWDGDSLEIAPGATLLRLGGHFPGGTVLHSTTGALLVGDILQITPGADRVSFMWSYPNMMPLPAREIGQIETRLKPWRYERLYGAFPGQEIHADAEAIVAKSASRYVELLAS